MRTIKFRGFDAIGEKGWVYGDLVHNQRVTTTGLQPRVMVGGYEVIEDTVGQFTGLTDKNGKEIYEGDIVQGFYKGRYKEQKLVCVIGWDKDNACFYIHPQVESDDEDGLLSEPDEMEVIGNIHDNPELIEQKAG